MRISRFCCLGILITAGTCFAQMYTITDLGTLGGVQSTAAGINASGQVAGTAETPFDNHSHAFRTEPNSPINPAIDELDLQVGGPYSWAYAINDSGQVVGTALNKDDSGFAYRTEPNNPINPATDNLGAFPGGSADASGINALGQVVGTSYAPNGTHAYRTAPNSPINPATDDLGTLDGMASWGYAINAVGQVVGMSGHAFRTAPNKPINPATDDLGTLGGTSSAALAINSSGQVVGYSSITGDNFVHAFRTSSNSPINPATDDLGTLGVNYSAALAIDEYGQVVGESAVPGNSLDSAFIYSADKMYDLDNLIPSDSGWQLIQAAAINNAGEIAGFGQINGQWHAFLLTPIYNALVQLPIKADGSSVFKANRGVIPVKFRLTQNDVPTCTLPAAIIAVTRTAGGKLSAIDATVYPMQAESGFNFRNDGCQYHFNVSSSTLGVGTFRVDISISGIMVGHAVFTLK